MFTHTSTVAVGLACIVALVGVWLTKRKRNSSGLTYPLGPKGLPLIGSVFDINTKEPLSCIRNGRRNINPLADSTLCDIVHTQISGQDMVAINSEKVARILCDQRGTIYADRPKSPLM
ncbi:hypothetical protein PAXINDRAFT_94742 [Paxillus involutus ATCC 200175]|uniref:Cytochrome P450 n=1 Tax=Paxillus involutus ATCC 200175 TaxID=664439 RepID=A0A0C9SSA4_PAXIN|nr:hypothetical protein PAXINDRAFT_94742 [Paxillus involutus ATCC 200175]